jgi:hypothetical protein
MMFVMMFMMMDSLSRVNEMQEVSKRDVMMVMLGVSLGQLAELLFEIALVMAMVVRANLFQSCLSLIF